MIAGPSVVLGVGEFVSARATFAARHGRLVVLGCSASECCRLDVGWSTQSSALQFHAATGCGWPDWRDCRNDTRLVCAAAQGQRERKQYKILTDTLVLYDLLPSLTPPKIARRQALLIGVPFVQTFMLSLRAFISWCP